MKLIYSVLVALAAGTVSVYNFTIPTINGADKPMSLYQGRKVLIVCLPSTSTSSDSAFLRSIDTISTKYGSKLSVIAVPSFEDGYSAKNAGILRAFYNHLLSQSLTVTEGMFTHKTSVAQHPLFSWLTHRDQNSHFDQDIEGPRQKYLIDEKGELRAVIPPGTVLSSSLLDKITR